MKKFKISCDIKASLDNIYVRATTQGEAVEHLEKQDILNILSFGTIEASDVIVYSVEEVEDDSGEVEEDDRSELPWDYSKHFE